MHCSRAWLLTIAVATALAPAACGGSSPASCAQGTERCPCYGNSTCNPGLTCASNTCVNLGGAGGATGSAGMGGTTGSGGTSGSSKGGAGGTSAAGAGGTAIGGAGGSGGSSSCTNTSTDPPELWRLRPCLQECRRVCLSRRLLRSGRLRSVVWSVHHPAGRLHDLRGLLRKYRRDLRASSLWRQCYPLRLARGWHVPNVFRCHRRSDSGPCDAQIPWGGEFSYIRCCCTDTH